VQAGARSELAVSVVRREMAEAPAATAAVAVVSHLTHSLFQRAMGPSARVIGFHVESSRALEQSDIAAVDVCVDLTAADAVAAASGVHARGQGDASLSCCPAVPPPMPPVSPESISTLHLLVKGVSVSRVVETKSSAASRAVSATSFANEYRFLQAAANGAIRAQVRTRGAC
jgi:hypothetical protein